MGMRKVWVLSTEALMQFGHPPRAAKKDVINSIGKAGNQKFSCGVSELGVITAFAEKQPLDVPAIGIVWRELKPGEDLASLTPVAAGFNDKLMRS